MSKEFTKSYAINRIAELNEQIVEMTDNQNQTMRYLNRIRDENNQLKQQLEEKDKEIERLKERLSVFDNFKDNYGYTNYDDSEILEDLQSRAFQAEDDTQVVNELLQFFNIFDENELVDKVKEPQTQLAIQELEKVKNYFIEECEDGDGIKTEDRVIKKDIYEVADFIENQIKELKGE